MTLDGFCDHTAGIPDEEIHHHYANLLNNAGVVLYGRITYQLMQFWQTLLKNPSGEKSMDDFAMAIDKVPKIVFSNTLESTEWDSAKLSNQPIEEQVLELKKQSGKDIWLCGGSELATTLFPEIDELILKVNPILLGWGIPLFSGAVQETDLTLSDNKSYSNGFMLLRYRVNH